VLIHPTLDQMHQLGRAGMARAFTELEANPQSADLSISRMPNGLDCCSIVKPQSATSGDYGHGCAMPACATRLRSKTLIIALPVALTAGVGKSWLACALGQKACRDNRSVLYQRVPRMFGDLALARGDGRYPRLCAPSAASSC
jgi:IstB-like ATP binding protein